MNAIILSIGDELVLGQTVDTNSAWISQHLAAVGCDITAHMTVPDGQPSIERAIRDAIPNCDTLIISGGIGPTEDDLTRQALAVVMNQPLELNEKWLEVLKGFWEKRGRIMPEINRIQAMIPRSAKMIHNHAGTAAGIHATLPRNLEGEALADRSASRVYPPLDKLKHRPLGRILKLFECVTRDNVAEALEFQKEKGGLIGNILIGLGHCSKEYRDRALLAQKGDPAFSSPVTYNLSPKTCDVFVMPGVPKEMKLMFERDVLPYIKEKSAGAVILSKTLHTFGLGESNIAELLGELMKRDRNPSVGTTVANGIVSLRINARFDKLREAQQQLDQTEHACRQALGDLIFGQDDQTLPQIVGHLLKQKNQSVATAESCTGGLLAKMLTDIPGSSAYFTHGWVTYSNEAKTQLLGVPDSILTEHGAVSEPTVRAMTIGIMKKIKANHALAISGIAGPDGGTPTKPVGTVCIALATTDTAPAITNDGIQTRTFNFPGDREMIRDRSAKMALTMLRYHLLEKPLPF